MVPVRNVQVYNIFTDFNQTGTAKYGLVVLLTHIQEMGPFQRPYLNHPLTDNAQFVSYILLEPGTLRQIQAGVTLEAYKEIVEFCQVYVQLYRHYWYLYTERLSI